MSQQYDTGCRGFTSAEPIPQFSRVSVGNDGRISVAGLTEIGSGIAQAPAFGEGEMISVKLWNSSGTFKMIASKAVGAGTVLSTAASGKAQDTAEATSFKFCRSLESAGSEDEIIECELLHAAGVTAAA